MTPSELEEQIQAQSAAVESWYRRAQSAEQAGMGDFAIGYRRKARDAAAEVGRLVAMRSPATVRRMERERGLR